MLLLEQNPQLPQCQRFVEVYMIQQSNRSASCRSPPRDPHWTLWDKPQLRFTPDMDKFGDRAALFRRSTLALLPDWMRAQASRSFSANNNLRWKRMRARLEPQCIATPGRPLKGCSRWCRVYFIDAVPSARNVSPFLFAYSFVALWISVTFLFHLLPFFLAPSTEVCCCL